MGKWRCQRDAARRPRRTSTCAEWPRDVLHGFDAHAGLAISSIHSVRDLAARQVCLGLVAARPSPSSLLVLVVLLLTPAAKASSTTDSVLRPGLSRRVDSGEWSGFLRQLIIIIMPRPLPQPGPPCVREVRCGASLLSADSHGRTAPKGEAAAAASRYWKHG